MTTSLRDDLSMNSLVIDHQDGLCVYAIERVQLQVGDGVLDLEVFAEENTECALGFLPAPILYIEGFAVPHASLDSLEEVELAQSQGSDAEIALRENRTGSVMRIYMGGHYFLDNNRVRIQRTSPGSFSIEWTADAEDFNYYDERALRNSVRLRCECEVN
ncbi:hypothetical protein [Hydrogenophaga sp. 5NK40-0174]|uniref:hypothetical protein n=1 Tax=Hydrogenophaga sp. 5NK40-0174 TaxID=3127649 RepID=UPI003101EA85